MLSEFSLCAIAGRVIILGLWFYVWTSCSCRRRRCAVRWCRASPAPESLPHRGLPPGSFNGRKQAGEGRDGTFDAGEERADPLGSRRHPLKPRKSGCGPASANTAAGQRHPASGAEREHTRWRVLPRRPVGTPLDHRPRTDPKTRWEKWARIPRRHVPARCSPPWAGRRIRRRAVRGVNRGDTNNRELKAEEAELGPGARRVDTRAAPRSPRANRGRRSR